MPRQTVVTLSALALLAWSALAAPQPTALTAALASAPGSAPVLVDGGSSTNELTAKKTAVDAAVAKANATYESATAAVQAAAARYASATAAIPGAESDLANAKGSVISASVRCRPGDRGRHHDAGRRRRGRRQARHGRAKGRHDARLDRERHQLGLSGQRVPRTERAADKRISGATCSTGFGYADQVVRGQQKSLNTYVAARMRAKDSLNRANETAKRALAAKTAAAAALTKSRAAQAAAQKASDDRRRARRHSGRPRSASRSTTRRRRSHNTKSCRGRATRSRSS